MLSGHSISNLPPGKFTEVCRVIKYPRSTDAISAAQAALPHEAVIPVPLSQTLKDISPDFSTCAMLTFTFLGNNVCFSSFGPKLCNGISLMLSTKKPCADYQYLLQLDLLAFQALWVNEVDHI